jgi:hypothetical protein
MAGWGMDGRGMKGKRGKDGRERGRGKEKRASECRKLGNEDRGRNYDDIIFVDGNGSPAMRDLGMVCKRGT